MTLHSEVLQSAAHYTADDAPWKRIQQNTFTRWANEHLKQVNKNIGDLQYDLGDGLRLVSLIEVLSGKMLPKHNKRPNFRSQKLENVSIAFDFLSNAENIKLVNIDSTDIVDHRLKLILGLIWTLILHYSISMPMWEGEDPEATKDLTPKQRLLRWIQNKIPDLAITNFTSDWNDGRAVGALVDAVAPGLIPDWQNWKSQNRDANAREAMQIAEDWLDVPQLVRPEEMVDPNVDEQSMMTYLSQFPNARLKKGAPVRQPTNTSRVRAYGPGIEPNGNKVGQKAPFTVETFSAGSGDVKVRVLAPDNRSQVPCEVKFNNDRNKTFSCVYTPTQEGKHMVEVNFSEQPIPKSPFTVNVKGFAVDTSKVSASGPGIQPTGNQAGVPTYFDVNAKNAGATAGSNPPEVVIVNPQGAKDAIHPNITPTGEGLWRVDYTAPTPGTHSVNVFYGGKPIPLSPFAVKMSPQSDPKKVRATGRGLQRNGVRVGDTADFRVFTEGAGEGPLDVKVIGPGGRTEKCDMRRGANDFVTECQYFPQVPGRYSVLIQYGGKEIPRSPFEVNVGKKGTTKIRAFGPGLEGGVVGMPACFTVEMNGEDGTLGFSIEGPSQAKIDCHDNGDGTADVTYWPTQAGEYAVHILCNDEDIPKSPYMAQIIPPQEYRPDKVKAYGPGLERNGVKAGQPTEFTVDAKQAGKAPVQIVAIDQEYNAIPVHVQDLGNQMFKCTYTPTRPIKHTIMVNYGGVAVPKSPFRVYVEDLVNPQNVRVYGPGVEKGVLSATPTHFIVDCSQAGKGEVQIRLTNDKNQDVPFKINDNHDGTFRVEYTAPSPGDYVVQVLFAGKDVPQSPIRVHVQPHIDVSNVRIEGLESSVPQYSQQSFRLVDSKHPLNPKEIECDIVHVPSGKKLPVNVTTDNKQPNAVQVAYMPADVGQYEVRPRVGKMPVPNTPQKFQCTAGVDPGKVICTGDGLSKAQVQKPAHVNIDPRKAGRGQLTTTMTGPGQVPLQQKQNPDGTVDVTYTPTVAGPYQLNILYDQKPVPGSPFNVTCTDSNAAANAASQHKQQLAKPTTPTPPAGGPGAVILSGEGLYSGEVDKPAKFLIDPRAAGLGPIGVGITGPGEAPLSTTDNGDGTYTVQYVPKRPGQYEIMVTFNDQVVPKCPYRPVIGMKGHPGMMPDQDQSRVSQMMTSMHKQEMIKKAQRAQAIPDASKVECSGDGLYAGEVDKLNSFNINTTKAGFAPLNITMSGPSECDLTPSENADGSITVNYKPSKPGQYELVITFNGKGVPGSPFRPVVGPTGQPGVFVVDRLTQDSRLSQQQQPSFGQGQQYKRIETIKRTQQTTHRQEYVQMPPDASKVRIEGDGLVLGEVNKSCQFQLDTSNAGVGNISMSLSGPAEAPMKVKENMDGLITVQYTPTKVGQYELIVTFADQAIPGSPFHPVIGPTGQPGLLMREQGHTVSSKMTSTSTSQTTRQQQTQQHRGRPDASKVYVYGDGLHLGEIDKQSSFTLDTRQAGGQAPINITLTGPAEAPLSFKENSDGTITVFYTPTKPGQYELEIKYDNTLVPGSPYHPIIGPRGKPGVLVHEQDRVLTSSTKMTQIEQRSSMSQKQDNKFGVQHKTNNTNSNNNVVTRQKS